MVKTDVDVYDDSSISSYEGVDAVRKRPTMYLQELGSGGIYRCIQEVVGNSLDEYNAGRASKIEVRINENTLEISVKDDGGGIPIGKLEKCATELHTGGKLDGHAYSDSIGLNGVGLTCANACSTTMHIQVIRDGKEANVTFTKGHVSKPKVVKPYGVSSVHGTLVEFTPDEEVFGNMNIDAAYYGDYLYKLSCVNAGVVINYFYLPKGKTEWVIKTYESKNGIADYLNISLLKGQTPIFNQPIEIKRINGEVDEPFGNIVKHHKIGFQAYFTWCKSTRSTIIHSFVNGIPTSEHGYHVDGFKDGIEKILKRDLNEIIPKKEDYYGKANSNDCFEGFVGVIQGFHDEPLFDSQTKNHFTANNFKPFAAKIAAERFEEWTQLHPKQYRDVLNSIILALKARVAANKARDKIKGLVKSDVTSLTSIDRYRPARTRNPKEAELFIVEGDSAGGSAHAGRDPKIQALYYLMGKPQNAYGIGDVQKIFKDTKINALRDLVSVLGCGWGSNMDPGKCRFAKIIIMADADADGGHIASLILGFMYRFYPELIASGHVFIANPPLFEFRFNRDKKFYVASMNQYHRILEKSILKRFDVCVLDKNGCHKTSKEFSQGFLIALRGYKEALDSCGNQTNVKPRLLEKIITNYDEIFKHNKIRVDGWDLNVYYSDELKCNIIEGVYENMYHKIEMTDFMMNIWQEAFNAINKIRWSNIILKDKKSGKKLGPCVYDIANGIDTIVNRSATISRFKGLGEMTTKQLWETTMDPERRILTKVTMDMNLQDKYTKVLDTMIGNDIASRKEFYKDFLSY